ncbi:MAG TPA: tRNA threonylcarbamoyladenosine dehydratase [Treponema sp.]|nr:tRNA threonylcarbamoyladenosine dehydratase [Treponema sp.]
METQFDRTQMILGKEALETLSKSYVAIFGIGGVGGYVAEALARSGVGQFDLIDSDIVSITNLNRQIVALHSTLGQYKVDVMQKRIYDINPQAQVNVFRCFYLPETKEQFDFSKYDYVVDAVDTVAAKIQLIEQAKENKTPLISCMGAGNKLNPMAFRVADISETSVCPLARVIRRECKARNIINVKVVFSTESPKCMEKGQQVPASTAFVPSAAGLLIASEVVQDLIKK